MAEPDRVWPGALDQLVVQQHVEAAAVHRVLRPVVAGEQPARLGVDVVAIQPHQRPFLGGQADAVEVGLRDAEIVKLAHGVRLHVDADAERAHLAHRFEYDTGHADLVQRQCRRQPANAAAGDDDLIIRHTLGPIYSRMNFIILWMTTGASHLRPSKLGHNTCPRWVKSGHRRL